MQLESYIVFTLPLTTTPARHGFEYHASETALVRIYTAGSDAILVKTPLLEGGLSLSSPVIASHEYNYGGEYGVHTFRFAVHQKASVVLCSRFQSSLNGRRQQVRKRLVLRRCLQSKKKALLIIALLTAVITILPPQLKQFARLCFCPHHLEHKIARLSHAP